MCVGEERESSCDVEETQMNQSGEGKGREVGGKGEGERENEENSVARWHRFKPSLAEFTQKHTCHWKC